jgi:hypothetical protein
VDAGEGRTDAPVRPARASGGRRMVGGTVVRSAGAGDDDAED